MCHSTSAVSRSIYTAKCKRIDEDKRKCGEVIKTSRKGGGSKNRLIYYRETDENMAAGFCRRCALHFRAKMGWAEAEVLGSD